VTEPTPLFIKYDGCINCPICKENQKRNGFDYGGFDHELLASCVINGCEMWGHSLLKPFITPTELRRKGFEKQAEMLEKELDIAAWNKEKLRQQAGEP
jgi:hypothetical protein